MACPFCGSAITAAARGAAEDAAAASHGLAGASRAKRYAVRAALLAGAASLGACGSGNKATNNAGSSGAGNGDTVLVQTTATAQPDDHHDPDDRVDPRERRRHDPNLPPMPYGCVWPDEELAV